MLGTNEVVGNFQQIISLIHNKGDYLCARGSQWENNQLIHQSM